VQNGLGQLQSLLFLFLLLRSQAQQLWPSEGFLPRQETAQSLPRCIALLRSGTRVQKTGRIRQILAKFGGFGLSRFQKSAGYTVHNFTFFEKIKKYVKKLHEILRLVVKKFF
jgi:hypothetical protein